MRIFFEGYHYDPARLTGKLDGVGMYFEDVSGNKKKTDRIGYFYSADENEPVFFLPKVFINAGGKAFGEDPHNIICVDAESSPLRKRGEDTRLYELSVWIYRAIKRYNDENDNIIVKESGAADIRSEQGDNAVTWLDIVLSLVTFSRKHKSLFTRISIINRSGNNNIHWGKTIGQVQPYIQDDAPVYLELRNKKKVINYDEELIVLMYSVLDYMKSIWHINVDTDLNYKLLSHEKIEQMLEDGMGVRYLRSIRKKYFTDELVSLWNLLLAFFDKTGSAEGFKGNDEALLTKSFDRIFEAMVDDVIGDDTIETDKGLKKLKHQEDGKEVDHLYKYKSLIDDTTLFFIGDSKYYPEEAEVDTPSTSKQYTYAKNVLDVAIRHQLDGEWENVTLRDYKEGEICTEGYNPIPNFFIRGSFDKDRVSYEDPQIVPGKAEMSVYYPDRLFDRNTLMLQSFNMNFLYLVATYSEQGANETEKQIVWDIFRHRLKERLMEFFNLFKVTPADNSEDGIKDFIFENGRRYPGKMYRSPGASFIWFALSTEKGHHDKFEVETMFPGATVEQHIL